MLSVIIVTWNGLRYLPECLAALVPQLPTGSELILVDNGSTDGTQTWICANYPQARLLCLTQNHGFAGGVNAGLRVARGSLLLLINNDAFVELGFIDALLKAAEDYPEVGAFGTILTFAHQPSIVASAGIRTRRDGVALDLWAGRNVAELPLRPEPIGGASGGALLYRRRLLDDIGPMASEFFNYLEDVDLAWRALLRGWQSMIVPTARARHIYSATAGQGSPFKQRLLGRNRLAAIIRCFPGPLLRSCLPAMLAYDTLAIGYALLYRQYPIASGRLEALRALPMLLEQRRLIQARRTAPVSDFARWLEPAPLPWASLEEQQQLQAILDQRPSL